MIMVHHVQKPIISSFTERQEKKIWIGQKWKVWLASALVPAQVQQDNIIQVIYLRGFFDMIDKEDSDSVDNTGTANHIADDNNVDVSG